MLTKEQRDHAERLRDTITDAQCDDDPDVEELRVALSRCVGRYDSEAPSEVRE